MLRAGRQCGAALMRSRHGSWRCPSGRAPVDASLCIINCCSHAMWIPCQNKSGGTSKQAKLRDRMIAIRALSKQRLRLHHNCRSKGTWIS